MSEIRPNPGGTPLDALIRQHAAETEAFFAEWDEEEFVPATDAEMREGMRDAMRKFEHLLPSAAGDECGCVTCRGFRAWLAAGEEH